MTSLTGPGAPPAALSGSPSDELRVVVDGCGLTGMGVVRQLAANPSVALIGVATSSEDRRVLAADILGPKVCDAGALDHPDVAIISAAPSDHDDRARVWLSKGAHVVSVSSDVGDLDRLGALGPAAEQQRRSVIVGAGLAPGLTCLLAVHAMSWFEEVNEVRISSYGVAGPACARSAQHSLHEESEEWRDGEWVARAPGSGRELSWFPDPVAGRDCYAARTGEAMLLHQLVPTISRISTRVARPEVPRLRRVLPLGRAWSVDPIGAIRVEVRGARAGRSETLVYGLVDRPSVATAAVAVTAALAAARRQVAAGAGSIAQMAPVPFLRELASLGVRAAVFEGSD